MAVYKDVMGIDKLTELALKAGEGDEIAMDELLPIVMDKSREIAHNELWHGSIEDREDLSQDILCRFLNSLSTFRAKSCFDTWFYRLAKNTAIMSYRKTIAQKRQPAIVESQEYDESEYDQDLEYQKLSALFRKCTNAQKSVMMLLYQGSSLKQIAETMNISYDAVRSRQRRGIKQIRTKLGLPKYGNSTNT